MPSATGYFALADIGFAVANLGEQTFSLSPSCRVVKHSRLMPANNPPRVQEKPAYLFD